mgnify:CR=1 FL=1
MEAKNMKTEELIGALVELDKQGKENRALTNAYKAELQARGISIMDDHNVKYVKFYGDAGSASITDSMSLDILNPDKLKKLIGEGVWNTKVKESKRPSTSMTASLRRCSRQSSPGTTPLR